MQTGKRPSAGGQSPAWPPPPTIPKRRSAQKRPSRPLRARHGGRRGRGCLAVGSPANGHQGGKVLKSAGRFGATINTRYK